MSTVFIWSKPVGSKSRSQQSQILHITILHCSVHTCRQLTLRGLPRLLLTTSPTTVLGLSAEPAPSSRLYLIRLWSVTSERLSSAGLSWLARRLRTAAKPLSSQHRHAFVNNLPGENFGLWPKPRGLVRLFFSETTQLLLSSHRVQRKQSTVCYAKL